MTDQKHEGTEDRTNRRAYECAQIARIRHPRHMPKTTPIMM